jgi:hypothetical protein
VRTEFTPAQTSDYLGFDLVMTDNLPEPLCCWPAVGKMLIAFERTQYLASNPNAQVPQDAHRSGSRIVSAQKHSERCFNKLKNSRCVATRYDKTADSYLSFIDVTSIGL